MIKKYGAAPLLWAECLCPSPSPNLYVEALTSSTAVF